MLLIFKSGYRNFIQINYKDEKFSGIKHKIYNLKDEIEQW